MPDNDGQGPRGRRSAPEQDAPLKPHRLWVQVGQVLGVALAWALLLAVLVYGLESEYGAVEVAGPVTWDNAVGPLLQQHCVVCHGDAGGLSLGSYEAVLRGGNRGPAVVPGDSEDSLLVQVLLGMAPSIPRMPPGGEPLPPQQIALIAQWIDQGAPESIPSEERD